MVVSGRQAIKAREEVPAWSLKEIFFFVREQEILKCSLKRIFQGGDFYTLDLLFCLDGEKKTFTVFKKWLHNI